MTYDTDIAREIFRIDKKQHDNGVNISVCEKNGVNIFCATVNNPSTLNNNSTPPNTTQYITLDFPPFASINHKSSLYIDVLAHEIRTLLPASGKVLVVGLGNPYLLADALGPKTLTGLFVTGHLPSDTISELSLRRVNAFSVGVEHSTGIATNTLLQAITTLTQPACVVCIDSLCAKKANRLGTTVQLSNNGLCSIGKQPINQQLLGVPVVGIGVPTVMRLKDEPNMTITPKDIDIIIKRSSSMLALGLNCALQPALSLQEICLLVS